MITEGQAAIVSGGASGLGGATADMLAAAGAKRRALRGGDVVGQPKAGVMARGGVFFPRVAQAGD